MKIRFQGLAEKTADETVHFLVIAVLCGARERSIVFINQDDSPLFKLGMKTCVMAYRAQDRDHCLSESDVFTLSWFTQAYNYLISY